MYVGSYTHNEHVQDNQLIVLCYTYILATSKNPNAFDMTVPCKMNVVGI